MDLIFVFLLRYLFFSDYIDDSRSGNYSAGASAVVRVQRSNGVFREDIGFGSNWGQNKADVISKAKKVIHSDRIYYDCINQSYFITFFLIKFVCAGCCHRWIERSRY